MIAYVKRSDTYFHWLQSGMFLMLTLSMQSLAQATDTQGYISARQIYSSTQCSVQPRPAVIPISNQSQLKQAVQKLPDQLPAQSETQLQVDFTQHQALLIHMGQQPSSGYSLSLQSVRLNAEELIINVHWQTPPPGLLQAQLITQPCILIQIPHLTIRKIQVNDQHGQIRIQQQK